MQVMSIIFTIKIIVEVRKSILIDQLDIKFPEFNQLNKYISKEPFEFITSLIIINESKVDKKILNIEIYIKSFLFKKLIKKTIIKKLIKGKKTGNKYILSF